MTTCLTDDYLENLNHAFSSLDPLLIHSWVFKQVDMPW